MMEDLKYKWEQIDEDDFVAKHGDIMLRVEQMDKQKWWWAVYQNDEELCDEDKPFARNKYYAMKMAEQCAENE